MVIAEGEITVSESSELTLQSYHFSLGNSTDGPVGFCARVLATSKEQAVARLQEALHAVSEVKIFDDMQDDEDMSPGEGIEYINVYLNADAVQASDIDEIDDPHDEEE